MRHETNNFFHHILASSAWFAAFTGALALVFSAYVQMQPMEKVSLKERVNFIRAAVAPRTFLIETFSKDPSFAHTFDKPMQEREYRSTTPSNEDIRITFNDFAAQIYGKTYSQKQFDLWLNPTSPLGIKWSPLIDNTSAKTDDNVSFLIKSMLLDYTQRLGQLGASIQIAKSESHKESPFSLILAPSAYEDMPNVLARFSVKMSKTLATIAEEVQKKESKRLNLLSLATFALKIAFLLFGYSAIVLLFLRAPLPVFLVAFAMVIITGASVAATFALAKSAAGIGEISLVFIVLVFATNMGLFNVVIGKLNSKLLKKKILFDAFLPILLIIFLISFVNEKISTYMFLVTMPLYLVVLLYLTFSVKSSKSKGASHRDTRLRSEWKQKLALISRNLPFGDSRELARSLTKHIDSNTTDFFQTDANNQITENLDQLLDLLNQPTHNPYVVRSNLLSLKALLDDTMK